MASGLVAIFAVLIDGFLHTDNVLSIVQNESVLRILGAGMAISIIGRRIDLSVVSVMAYSVAWALSICNQDFNLLSIEKRRFFHGGEVLLDGKRIRYRAPKQAVRDGIVCVTEDRKIEGFFDSMSISENIHTGSVAAGLAKGFVLRMDEMKDLADH